jgi:hypothetical protein
LATAQNVKNVKTIISGSSPAVEKSMIANYMPLSFLKLYLRSLEPEPSQME